MSQTQSINPGPGRKRHRLRNILVALMLIVPVTIAALPTLAGLPPIRVLILAAANRALAPTRIELKSLSLAWFGPVRMTGLVLRDGKGKAVVSAPTATLDRDFAKLLFDRPNYGTLTLQNAVVDIERRADGSIDLAEALDPILAPAPKKPGATAKPNGPATDFTLKVEKGSLKLASPELGEPIRAARLDMTLRVPAALPKMVWQIALANPSAPGGEALEIDGAYEYGPATGPSPELSLTLTGSRWPVAPVLAGIVGRGRFDGKVEARRHEGRWSSSGDARVLDLDASGPALAGDRLRFDRAAGVWDLDMVDGGWSIRKLDVTSPLGEVVASGMLAGSSSATGRVDARLDLAALARHVPHALHLRDGLSVDKGDFRIRAEVRNEAAGRELEVSARVSELTAHDKVRAITLHEPTTLAALIPLRADGQLGVGTGIGMIEVKSACFDLKGSGDLINGGKLSGTVDLGGLQTQLRQLVDFGKIDVSGQSRVAAAIHRNATDMTAQLALEIREPKLAGLTAEPLRRDAIRLEFAAISAATATDLIDSLHTARIGIKADDFAANLEARRKDKDAELGIKAEASGVIPLASLAGRGEGKLAGRWSGKVLAIDEVHAAVVPGPADSKNTPLSLTAAGKFDTARGTLDLEPRTKPGDSIVVAPEGLHLSGLGGAGAGGPLGADGGGLNVDIATLDRALATWSGGTASELAGVLAVRGTARLDRAAGLLTFGAKLDSPDLSTPGANGKGRTMQGPIVLAAKGTYATATDLLTLADLGLSVPHGALKAAGTLAEATGRRVADIKATLVPSWDLLKALALGGMASEVMISGDVRPFRVRGPLSGGSTFDILRGLETELRVDLGAIRAFGLHTDPMPVVVRCAGGQVAIEPLSTGLNGGRLELKPEVALDDPKGPSFRLAPGSEIREIELDDEVSRRVLAYFVPVLHNSTQVRGRLSTAFDRAEFPMGGDPDRSVSAAGKIIFKDVTCGPGSMGQQLLGIVGRDKAGTLRLNDTVTFEVINGRVKQEGLAIPVAKDAQIEIAGSVGFDSTLRLHAAVPITKAMLGGKALAGELGDTKINLPIGGTLSHPTIERRALQVGLRDAGRNLIRKEASGRAADALKRLPLPKGADGDAIKDELQNLFRSRKKR